MMRKLLSLFLILSSFAASAQNPGNIGTTNLTAWFKPDALTLGPLLNWTTTFPTGGSAIVLDEIAPPYPTVVNTPLSFTSNYNRTIDFAGNGTGTDMVMQNTTLLNLLNNNSAGGTGTMLCAFYVPVGATGHMVMYREGSFGSVDGIQFRNLGGSCRLALGTSDSPNGSRDYTETRKTELISYHGNKSGVGTMSLYQKSRLITGGPASSTTGDQGLFLGARRTGTFNGHFTGFLSEVIFYNQNLTATEYEKVNSYMAIKYGITLSNFGAGVAGDYRSTDGRLLWDADYTSVYHNSVIGIGRDDNEALLQKQSHSFDDTTRVYLSTLQTNNDANTGSFSNDISYVMVGDNAGVMCTSNASNFESPVCGLYTRLVREWKVTKTNMTDNFSIDITLSTCASPGTINVADLKLLVDDDGNFGSGGTNIFYNGDGTGIVITYASPVITISNLSATHFPNDSTKYFTFLLRPIVPDTININTCASYTSPSGRHTYTSSGEYADTIVSALLCDSVIIIDLNLGSSSNDTIYQTICNNQSYLFNGVNLVAAGTYLDTFNLGVCDSFATLILSVNSIDSSSISQNICSNQSYLFNAVNLNIAGIYDDTLVNRFGCDSFVRLTLSVIPTSTGIINRTICSNQSYLFNGVNLNTTGTYIDTLINSRLCDSFLTLNLTVNPTTAGSINRTICSNQFYLFNGVNLNSAGTYLDTLLNSNGCDSVLTLNLTVNSTTSSSINATICSNQFYLFNGINRNIAGTYLDTFINSAGCDSVLTLNLSINPTSSGTINASICAGQSYLFNDINRTASGTYLDTAISYLACDSVITLNLTVVPTINTTLNQSICNGLTYFFNGVNISSTGTYRDTFLSIIGCDSIVTLNLFVSPFLASTINRSICNNQIYLFNGINLNTAGTYLDTVRSALGCDSFLTLNLSVFPIASSVLNDTICAGAQLNFGAQVLSTAGNYTDTLNTVNGCDSIIYLSLYIDSLPRVIINAGNDTSIVLGASINLQASGASSYLWDNGNSSAILAISPTASASYIVTGTDSNGCSAADTLIVFVYELKDSSALALPSGFSPNGDGLNDIFRILKTYNLNIDQFAIFNRWGELIFQTNDIEVGWDGAFKDRPQPMGTYVYYIQGKSQMSNKTRSYNGVVTLIR